MAKVTVRSRLADIAAHAERTADETLQASARRVADDARGRAPGSAGDTIDAVRQGSMDWAVVANRPWRYLEFGTVKMGARPFVLPAAEAERDHLHRAVRDLFL